MSLVHKKITNLYISVSNLPYADIFNLANPFIVCYLKSGDHLLNIGHTEVVADSISCDFVTPIEIEYHFQSEQSLRFAVFHEKEYKEKNIYDTENEHLIGACEINLGVIIGSKSPTELNLTLPTERTGILKMLGRPSQGKLKVYGTEKSSYVRKDILDVQFEAKLKSFSWFSLPNAYIVIKKEVSHGNYIAVWRSETIKNSLHPIWNTTQILLDNLCDENITKSLHIEIYSHSKSSQDKYLGVAEACLQSLTQHEKVVGTGGENALSLTLHCSDIKSPSNNVGEFFVHNPSIIERRPLASFVDGGLQLNLVVGIDFSVSNGENDSITSLHYTNKATPNEYQQAISEVGKILEDYDTDKMIPFYGFGGSIESQVHHVFPLTFDPSNPEVHGVDGMLQAYSKSVSAISLSEPVRFAPLIHKVISMASNTPLTQSDQQYFILNIITSSGGEIIDKQDTIDAIIEASYLPISIVFIGIGRKDTDFTALEYLDSDDQLLKSYTGKKALRDIVQFVPFLGEFKSSPSIDWSNIALGKETLAELPDQVISFFQRKGIVPNINPVSSGQRTKNRWEREEK